MVYTRVTVMLLLMYRIMWNFFNTLLCTSLKEKTTARFLLLGFQNLIWCTAMYIYKTFLYEVAVYTPTILKCVNKVCIALQGNVHKNILDELVENETANIITD